MAKRRTHRNASAKPYSGPPPQFDLFNPPKQIKDLPDPGSAVILIEREPILKEWRDRYRLLERELAELSKQTEDYHFQAVPAFQSWVARAFGEELSAIREMEEAIREAELIAVATLEEARVTDSPQSEAFQVVMLRKERGEDLFPTPDDWDDGWEEVDPERDYRAEAEEDPKKDPDETSREYFRDKEAVRASVEKADEASRLKLLYRKLVFALHPDANPNQTERERKIWDEVQIAYADRDLERLEMLHAWIGAGSEGWLDRMTHAGTLRTLVLQKLTEVRANHSEFNRLRKASPWKFWMARESERRIEDVRLHVEEDFFREFRTLQRRLREFEIQFQRWERGNHPTQKKSSRRRRTPSR